MSLDDRPTAPDVSAELDALILSLVSAHWQKMALILGRIWDAAGQPERETSLEEAAACIEASVLTGRLEAQGDLSRWRHSEIRMPARLSAK